MEKNYNTELDFILGELVKSYENQFKGIHFYSEDSVKSVKDQISEILMEKFGLKDWVIDLLYHNLLRDKYIMSIETLTITMEGLLFKNNGAYTQKIINQNSELLRIQKLEKSTKKNEEALVLFTALLAFGNLISAWFFVIEIWKFYSNSAIK